MSVGKSGPLVPGWNEADLSGSIEQNRDELSSGTARSIPETDAVFHENNADEFGGSLDLDGALGDFKTIRLDREARPSSVGHASCADWSSESICRAVEEAELEVATVRQFLLPWETSHLAPIFGGSDTAILQKERPQAQDIHDLTERREPELQPAVSRDAAAPAFLACARIRPRRNPPGLHLVLKRWMMVILHAPSESEAGIQLMALENETERLSVLQEILGGKSQATLSKRVSFAQRMIRWWVCGGDCKQPFFPPSAVAIIKFMRSLRDSGARISVLRQVPETLLFLKHVLGFEISEAVLTSPNVKGILRHASKERPPRKQSRPLKVSEVAALECIVQDHRYALLDRYAAGVIVFMVLARARCSDVKDIFTSRIDVMDEGLSKGYIEMSTFNHKNAMHASGTGLPLLLIASVIGVTGDRWGKAFLDVSMMMGKDLKAGFAGPLLTSPDKNGRLTEHAVTAAELGLWLRALLQKQVEPIPGLTGHGIKATALSWAARYGLPDEVRAVLGHHSMRGRDAIIVYARDHQAMPLRKLDEVLQAIRSGVFLPDNSRASYFDDASPDVREEAPACEDHEDPPADDVHASGHDSTSSSSESSSGDESGLDEAVVRASHVSPEPTNWGRGTPFEHNVTRTLHVLPEGSTTNTFVCGRFCSDSFTQFKGQLVDESAKCKQCMSGKAARDLGSLLAVMDRAKKPRVQ